MRRADPQRVERSGPTAGEKSGPTAGEKGAEPFTDENQRKKKSLRSAPLTKIIL